MIRNASTKASLHQPYLSSTSWYLPISSQRIAALTCVASPRKRAIASPIPRNTPKRCYHRENYRSENRIEQTIYGLSTAPGRGAIAIVRISGKACFDIYKSLCLPKSPGLRKPNPRYASVRTLHHPTEPANILDSSAVVLFFPAPQTVTGEDVLELHIHGGPATVKAVLSAIPKCRSYDGPPQWGQLRRIRYADPGEFTRRAFQNDRLDLAQVEALSDTLSAETEQQRRAAVRGNSGNLGRIYEGWRQQLLHARGELEALIDFSEDQHFDESPAELLLNVAAKVKVILGSIAPHERASHRGELLKRGIRISLLGPPNAGKSSLLNQLVGRDVSIVSQEPGTTRDVVEVSLDVRGYLCTFADTAGLRTKSEESLGSDAVIGVVEQEGIRRAKEKARESDVIIALASVEPTKIPGQFSISYDADTLLIATQAQESLLVINKCDLISDEPLSRLSEDSTEELLSTFRRTLNFKGPVIGVSCKEAERNADLSSLDHGNMRFLTDQIVKTFEKMTELPPDLQDLHGVTERQRQLLCSCSGYLNDFINEAQPDGSDTETDIVLAAEHLRSAASCLSRITGRGEAGDVEEVLGVVFEKFCVGK